MASILKFGKRVKKEEQNPNGWKILYTHRRGATTEESLIGHKSMICFPGDGVIYDEEMNGCCSNMKFMLENAGLPPEEMPQFYSTGFDTNTQGHRQLLLDQEGITRYGLPKAEDVTDYWTPFFNTYLLPLIQTSDGNPRSFEESAHNLQNITFVTHCHGSMFAKQIEQLFQAKIKEFYPDKEKEILGNIRMLHLASRKPTNQTTGVRHFNVISLADDMYADSGMLANDNIYQLLHKQSMDGRSAIIPISDKETVMVFRELTTPKTYGDRRDDHSHFIRVVSGKEKGLDTDKEAKENEEGLKFVRMILRHFVEHPEDTRPTKDIMKDINSGFTTVNIDDGHKLSSEMTKERDFGKSFLELLSQHSLRGVSGDARFYLQKTPNGEYFYQQAKEHALKTGDETSLRSLLKKVQGLLSTEDVVREVNEAIQRRDRRTVDLLTDRMLPNDISKFILSSAKPDMLPFLYPEIRKARLSSNGQRTMIDDLLKKSEQIQNSSGRVRIQTYLNQEKEKCNNTDLQRRIRITDSR